MNKRKFASVVLCGLTVLSSCGTSKHNIPFQQGVYYSDETTFTCSDGYFVSAKVVLEEITIETYELAAGVNVFEDIATPSYKRVLYLMSVYFLTADQEVDEEIQSGEYLLQETAKIKPASFGQGDNTYFGEIKVLKAEKSGVHKLRITQVDSSVFILAAGEYLYTHLTIEEL